MQQKQTQIQDIEQLPKKDRKALAAIFADPATWGELFLRNRDGSPRSFWDHQKEDLRSRSRHIIHQDGRDVGKSVCIIADLLHYAFTTKGGSGLVAAPHQGHLDTLIDELEFQLGENPDLMSSVAEGRSGHPAIIRKPYFKVGFISGTVIYFRPGGDYGKAFRSLHVDRVWVDEAAWLPEPAWRAVRQCLNAGGYFRVYSNPNGLRDTTYYRLTKDKGRWTIFHWPSSVNPKWSEEREQELSEFYGGRDTPGFQHEVLGEHGHPSYGAFNHEQFKLCQKEYDGYPWFEKLYSELTLRGKVCFATSPTHSPNSAAGKMAWLKDRFGSDFKEFIITRRKHHLSRSGTLLLDDSDKQVHEFAWKGSGSAVLFPQIWNSAYPFAVGDRLQYVLTQVDAAISGMEHV